MKNIISQLTLKELERIIYRILQETYSKVMAVVLVEMDQTIAEGRDKKMKGEFHPQSVVN